ncbi:phosphoribosylanthranilate isomerase [Rhodovibrionaceae bacterium A322]
MAIETKICGLSTPETVTAVVEGGARFAGFMFYPPSPRAVTPEQAASLAQRLTPAVDAVGVFVDPDDELLGRVLEAVPLDIIQLHGSETPQRVQDIRQRTGRAVMKVIKVARPEDLEAARDYAPIVDYLMFDAKAPKSMENALPGGNALSFDWRMLANRNWPKPWMLAGGLRIDNIAEAVAISGTKILDISSGVESAPGQKDPQLIRDFLARTKQL